ncbi:hypothetical protein F5887DRAFT_920321 [Amanita rubescens]|nr:hypothetical protein F5887DRAFT_920321 [Amanita rubescens]
MDQAVGSSCNNETETVVYSLQCSNAAMQVQQHQRVLVHFGCTCQGSGKQIIADMNFLEALAEAAKPSTERECTHLWSKHILVEGMEYDLRMEFDRRGLERVGNWDEPRTLQDLSIEPDTPKGFNGRVKDLQISKWENPKLLEATQFHWVHGLVLHSCKKHQQKPITTAGAISYWHLDTNGFATYIDVQVGKKWWVVANSKEGGPSFAKLL